MGPIGFPDDPDVACETKKSKGDFKQGFVLGLLK